MQTPEIPPARPRRRGRRILLIVAGVLVLGFVLLGVWVASCVRLGGEARALRNSVLKAASAQWDKKIEVSAGPLTLGLARAGSRFVEVPPEARLAIEAVRSAQVGVYRLASGQGPVDRVGLLSAADAAMAGRGWDRLLVIVERRDLVAMYAPKNAGAGQKLEVCALVLQGRELVVASARGKVEPLLDLAQRKLPMLGIPREAASPAKGTRVHMRVPNPEG